MVRFVVPVAAREWAATAARLLLAGVWAWAGVTKIGDPAAAVRAVRAYRLLPEWLAQGVGHGLPFLELTLAALLLAGLATRLAAVVSAGLLAVFLAGMVSAAARGLQIECGCFGGGGDLAAGQSTAYTWEIVRDVALLLVALALSRWPRSRLAADTAVRATAESKVDSGRMGPRRTAEARRIATQIDDLDPRTAEETLRGLWIRLGRSATGGTVMLVDDTVSVDEARAACLAAIAEPEPLKRGRGRPRTLDPGATRTTVRIPPGVLAEMRSAADAGGRSLNEEIIHRCIRYQEVEPDGR